MISSPEDFVHLRENNDPRAVHDSAADEVWHLVIQHHPEMREWVALNKTISLTIMRVLAADEDFKVRFSVAMKRSCGKELLAKLAGDPCEAVRLRVAFNPNTPREILQQLLGDKYPEVAKVAKQRLGINDSPELPPALDPNPPVPNPPASTR